jgi:hypothetical protein
MIRGILNTSAPVLASAGLYGITDSELGKTLIIVMAFAVILNQLWAFGEKITQAMKSKPVDLSGLSNAKLCEHHQARIAAALAALKSEDERQDRLNKEQFQTVATALVELRHEMRDEFKGIEEKFEQRILGLHKRSDAVLQAVSRLEGKVNS